MQTVLVVDDHEESRDVLAHLLMINGYAVQQAANGEEGVRLARLERPDVILMDLAMPVLGGVEATAILRDDPATMHIPVIAMSAHVTGPASMDGFAAFLEKPIDLDLLLETIARVAA